MSPRNRIKHITSRLRVANRLDKLRERPPIIRSLANVNRRRLHLFKDNLNRLLEFVDERISALEEVAEEETPYRISGAFEDIAKYVEPEEQEDKEQLEPEKSRRSQKRER